MKAFTVYQPYAYAIVAGLKAYETRPRRTNIRGRVAVHAGKTDIWKTKLVTLDDMRGFAKILSDHNKSKGGPHIPPILEFGAILGTVEIVDCVPVEEIAATLSERERLLGDYSPGRWAWVLKNPVAFHSPVPARGKQGWWNWNPDA